MLFVIFSVLYYLKAVHSLHAAAEAFLHACVSLDVGVKVPGRFPARRIAEANFAYNRAALQGRGIHGVLVGSAACITAEFIFPRQSVVTGKLFALLLAETRANAQLVAVDGVKVKDVIGNVYTVAFMVGMEVFAVNVPCFAVVQLKDFTDADVRAVVGVFRFVAVASAGKFQSVIYFVLRRACPQRGFGVDAVFLFVAHEQAAAVVDCVAVAAEGVAVKVVIVL